MREVRGALRGSPPGSVAAARTTGTGGATERPAPSTTLSVLGRLTGRLHEEDVLYCHWKDNDTLTASLQGALDVDLLVEGTAAPLLNRILAEVGFKPCVPCGWFAYPAIGHFLALDRQTARLTHVHVYYRLITGEGHLKGYHLPWEDAVLASRRLDAEHGIYTADPNVDMILFLVRAALKLRTYERLGRPRTAPCFRGRVLTKFRWLETRAAAPRVAEWGRKLLDDGAARRVSELLEGRPSMRGLLAFRRSVVTALHPHRRYGPSAAVWHRWLKEACAVWRASPLRRLFPPVPLRLTPATGGRLIAVVGPDGSGKSTVVNEIVAWLSEHVDVLPIYFGSGDGPVSPIRWPLQVAGRWWHRRKAEARARSAPARARDGGVPGTPPAGMRIARALWALILRAEKAQRLRRAWRAHERGMIVVCDRFPQNQTMGCMDGPLLSEWRESRSRLLRALARWERAPYDWAEAHPPDLVVRLDVAPEVASQRKPDMDLAEIRKRDRISRRLRYSPRTRVVPLDASVPLEEVVRRVKALVWDAI